MFKKILTVLLLSLSINIAYSNTISLNELQTDISTTNISTTNISTRYDKIDNTNISVNYSTFSISTIMSGILSGLISGIPFWSFNKIGK